MSIAFIFGPSGANDDMTGTIDFYETNLHVRQMFNQVADWTGFSIDTLLRRCDPPGDESLMRVNTISLAAGMLGICDALSDLGIHPAVVGGISLGGMLAGCVAGALTRRQLFDILLGSDHGPASTAPAEREGAAFVFVPASEDTSHYLSQRDRGVFLAADFGMVASGEGRMVMLTGYRSELEEFAAGDHNNVRVREERFISAAYHSPLREHARVKLARKLDGLHFTDPHLPVCSSIDGRTLTTAGQIKDLFLRNNVEQIRVSSLLAEIASHRPRLALAIGPSMRRNLFTFPFPVTHVRAPHDMTEAFAAASG